MNWRMKIMQKEYSWAQGVESVNTLFCSKICKRALIKSSVNETPQREATDIKKLYLNRQSIEGEPFFFFWIILWVQDNPHLFPWHINKGPLSLPKVSIWVISIMITLAHRLKEIHKSQHRPREKISLCH